MKAPWSAGQKVLLIVIVVAVLGLGVAGAVVMLPPGTIPFLSPPTCTQQSEAFLVKVENVAREWDDANKLAGSTSRMSLAPQIDKLQALRRTAQDLEAPECASLAKLRLTQAMDKSIDAYIAFLAQKSDSEVSRLFQEANDSLGQYASAVAALK